MFHRLHTQLTLFCTFITGLILLLMICVCLLISESGLRQQSRASFLSSLSSLYQELKDSNTLSLERLAQTSHNYNVILRITDQGVPLFYQQVSGQKDFSAMFDAARTAAAQYGIDPDGDFGTPNRILHAEYTVKAPKQPDSPRDSQDADNFPQRSGSLQNFPYQNVGAWASAALIPKPSGALGVIVLQPLTALSAHIRRQRLFFGAAGLLGLALLFLFSWHFTAQVLAPIEKNRKKQTQFIAAASHELRSPLTVMLSCVSAVRSGIVPDPDAYLKTVEAEGLRMSRLIGDMLALANADNYSWNIHPAPVELDTLLLETWESFEPLARSHRLKWDIRLPDDVPPPCVCDRERIIQVLEILIDNAFSYVPEGCRISLSLDYTTHTRRLGSTLRAYPAKERTGRPPFALPRFMDITALRDAQKYSVFCICVSDNGPGIPAAQREIIFDRFQRLDASRKDKSHFGLGLSIAREIVSLHGGSLTLEDTPGGGATFQIQLPALPPASPGRSRA